MYGEHIVWLLIQYPRRLETLKKRILSASGSRLGFRHSNYPKSFSVTLDTVSREIINFLKNNVLTLKALLVNRAPAGLRSRHEKYDFLFLTNVGDVIEPDRCMDGWILINVPDFWRCNNGSHFLWLIVWLLIQYPRRLETPKIECFQLAVQGFGFRHLHYPESFSVTLDTVFLGKIITFF